ncbi:MAG TPA: hypothetical protein VM778_12830 [Gemmatimonadota bacterium]|nr:hypothetical protein [Gemmatimonadota bacterium]
MTRPPSPTETILIERAIARLRAGAMAIVFALLGGGGLFVATAWLLVRGGPNVGENLALLRHYFPGYSVTWVGAVVGLAWGMVVGGLAGGSLALVYNRVARRPRGERP